VVKKNLKALYLSGSIVCIDQVTKILIKHFLVKEKFMPLFGKYIGFRFIENEGMMLGFQIGPKPFFTIFTAIASLIIVIFLFRLEDNQFRTRIALSAILGGAIGNLIDRILYGKVVDFIEIGPWPIFNFADVAVTFGMLVLIIVVFSERKEDKELQEEKFEINY